MRKGLINNTKCNKKSCNIAIYNENTLFVSYAFSLRITPCLLINIKTIFFVGLHSDETSMSINKAK